MGVAKLSNEGLETRLEYDGKTERLLVKDYPELEGFDEAYSQFCAFHLLAPHLPKKVMSQFHISEPMMRLIERMYNFEGKPAPEILSPSTNNGHIDYKKTKNKAVISYSAGKDSMWNLWWAQEKYGKNNVLAVHIDGLNRANAPDEKRYAYRQSKRLGFEMKNLTLVNSSGGKGFQVMRSRDMFMAGILIPYALGFGASHIIIEGFSEVEPDEPFTGHENNMKFFNKTLKEMDIPVQVEWRNRKEMDIVKDLYENVPHWMPEVCNCFSANCYKPFLHASWNGGTDTKGKTKTGRTPSLKLYDSQCGSCVKCRIINIGRILYDPDLKATDEDVKYYLQSTEQWYKEKLETHHDMITGSFLRDFRKAAQKYDVELKI